MYLTVPEAKWMREELDKLLKNPEANDHFHIDTGEGGREISCSIVTESKLKNLSGYSKLEQQVLSEKRVV
jgi:hypothetical protein